jgi:hypothetical protein
MTPVSTDFFETVFLRGENGEGQVLKRDVTIFLFLDWGA